MDTNLLKYLAKNATLLYVEDEDELRESVTRYLKKIFPHLSIAKNGQEGLELYRKYQYDIVISDIEMPLMSGIEMAKEIKIINPSQEIILISAYAEKSYFIDGIDIGINGYILKPIEYLKMNKMLYKSILNITTYKKSLEYKNNLKETVEKLTTEAITLEKEKIVNFEMTLKSFVSMLEHRDTYTGGHSQRVANYSRMIAENMQCSDEECDLIYRAGILHDIGKVSTPDTILLKPDKLSDLEYNIIKQHVTESYNILLKIPMYKKVAEIVICHHEHYDGSGYPNALKNKEIPFLSHIMIVADAFDAMTTNRVYKGYMAVEKAIEELKELSGKQFHPEVVKGAINVLSDVKIEKTINQIPITEVERERFSYFYRDQLTSAYNTDYLDFILNRNIFDKEYISINTLYLHNFNHFNQKYGWDEGDKLLIEVCNYLYNYFPSSLIFRVHGDDFVIINKNDAEIELGQSEYLKELEEKYSVKSSTHRIDLCKNKIPSLKVIETYRLMRYPI